MQNTLERAAGEKMFKNFLIRREPNPIFNEVLPEFLHIDPSLSIN